MAKREALAKLEEGLRELRDLVDSGTTFITEEFSLLISCLECLDRHVVGGIGDKGLLDLGFDR